PTGGGPSGAAAGDLNQDGWIDLAVADSTDNTVSVLLGKGGGTLGAQVDYATAPGARGVAAGDVHGDGKGGLAVACDPRNPPSAQPRDTGTRRWAGPPCGGAASADPRPVCPRAGPPIQSAPPISMRTASRIS